MKTIPQVAQAMQRILGPISDELAEATGFRQRESKVTGSAFMQTLVLSSLENSEWRYSQLVATALDAGVRVTKQGLAQRFSERSAELARRVLECAVQTVISSQPRALPLLERFSGVYLRDSSVVSLPKALETLWPGSASSHGSSAGIKLHTRLEVTRGELGGPVLAAGREHDRHSPFQSEALPKGALRMGDLGFFALQQFASDSNQGVLWLTRYKTGTRLYDVQGQPIDLRAWLGQLSADEGELAVELGQKHHLTCRLLVERVPAAAVAQRKRKLHEYARKKQTPLTDELLALSEWTILLTNIPTALLSIPEALILLRVRWQIELLFKRWKSLFQIDEWRSSNVWRILTELYAKLLGVLIQQWVLLTSIASLSQPSFWKAALVVRRFAAQLARALFDFPQLLAVLSLIHLHVCAHCHLERSTPHPSLYQLLEIGRVQP